MPELEPRVGNPQRLEARFDRKFPTDAEIKRWMLSHGVLSYDEISKLRADIDKYIRENESSLVSKIFSSLWYYIKSKLVFSNEDIYWALSNFDKLKDYMPTDFWKSVVVYIDKIGEYLLAKERSKK